MALDIVKLYISLLSQFFNLSDMAVMSTQSPSFSNATPTLLPENSPSLSTAHYLMKILGEIQECVNELNGMEISNDISLILKGLLDSAKWRFEDVLVAAWLRGIVPELIVYPHLIFSFSRREQLPPPRSLGLQPLRPICDALSDIYGALPATNYYSCVPTSRRR